jgi:hypothetical protein
MFGVMLFLCTSCLFVCITTSSSEVTSHLKTKVGEVPGNLKSKASCALDHSSLPNNVLINQCDMLRLILWDLIGFPSLVYPTPCRQKKLSGSFAIALPDFGILMLYYDHAPVMLLF